jgi:glyoxylase-like metal-dependent hydrolase (beta-lactamase superfamily II)
MSRAIESAAMRVGGLEIQPVHDGWARMPATDLLRFTGGRDDPWLPHHEFINADGSIELSLGGFLIRTGDRVVLVDAGAGRISNDVYHGGKLLESLAALGLGPDDVTDVVFTHLHFDHVGWSTQQGNVVFPRATFRCHSHDWEHFVTGPNPEAGSVRKLSPLADRLETFDGDTAVAPGITVRHAPGHTPGSAVIVVADGTERALLLGDVVHCPVELMENEWEAVVDVDPALASRTREALAKELEGSDVPVAAAHFPGLRFGRLLAGTGRRHWSFD